MAHADFVHLRVHSAYSLSEGAVRLKELVALCQKQAMPAVAVTDSGNLFGALEFSLAASGAGLQPVIGTILALKPPADPAAREARPALSRVVLLVQNEAGYRNLLTLVSHAYMATAGDEEPQVPETLLAEHAEGLLLLTGGLDGPVARRLLAGDKAGAAACLRSLAAAFPGRLYVELQRHGLPRQKAVEPALLDLAYELDLPLVATNDVFFPTEDLYEAHDALLCIAEGRYLAEDERRRVTPHHRFKSASEMRALFADLPEAADNTLVVARRCAWFPSVVKPILPAFPTVGGRSEVEELRAQAAGGLDARLAALPPLDPAAAEERARTYRERLDYELGIIEQMGFPGYFLIVSDFIKWAKAHGIPVGPGRGSGAGSVVAWSLTITDLDPIRWGLLFERFLNPERVSMPDFDIDFCQDRRDEVIRYVQEKYGRDRVAQIITFGKLQARAVLRDVGRVLQLSYGQVDRLCKMVPNNPANPVTLAQAIAGEPRLQEAQQADEQVARMIDMALKLEGLYRHASTHAAGVVIGDRPLQELVPLYRDPRSDMPVTQFNMKYVEQAGLVKFDFLGLKTLTVLARAEQLIRRHKPGFDLASVPVDGADAAPAYAVMAAGQTVGVFQLESAGMRDALRRLQPDRFEDIIAMVALYRPGPMENIPAYIKRKKGEEEPDYLHPSLEPILKETFGIMIYQEQVMQIAQVLAGYSLGGADLLRRAMGKKIKAEMDAQREIFVKGATARGVPEGQASHIFDLVNKFAGYGFNKSHAAAYALVAFHTAYLKAHYPEEFLAASMSFEMANTDKLNVFRQELDRQRIPLLPPDVNASAVSFEVEAGHDGRKSVRYALAAIRNVGTAAMEQLVAERAARGPFGSLADFAARLDPKALNKRAVENLVAAGALDGLERNRRRVSESAETIVRHAASLAEQQSSGIVNLFADQEAAMAQQVLRLPQVPDWSPMERLQREFDAIGFYLSAHPLDGFKAPLRRRKVVPIAELPMAVASGLPRHTLAGIVVSKQERTSKKGNRFAFVALSDPSGVYEVTLFSETLQKHRELLESGKPVLVDVAAERQEDGGDLRLTAYEFYDLEETLARSSPGLRVYVEDGGAVAPLKAVMGRERGGRGRLSLIVTAAGREIEIELPAGAGVSPAGRQAIKAIPGLVVQDL